MQIDIYQARDWSLGRNLRCEIMDNFNAKDPEYKVDASTFHRVYTIELPTGSATVPQALEHAYTVFNIAHPNGFKGWSLSEGDVVIVDGEAFLCTQFWAPIEFDTSLAG